MQRPRHGILAFLAALFYFSEGFPFGIVNELLPLYLRSSGVSLTQIGFLSTVGLAWTLKFFWSPAVDSLGTYRRWIAAALLGITLSIGLLALVPAGGTWFWILATLLVIGSATQDIAVDALSIAATERRWYGLVNSIRVTFYRVAMIAAGGGLALIAGELGWPAAFSVAAAVAGVALLATPLLPLEKKYDRAPSELLRGVGRWFASRDSIILLLIVLLYKLGDSALNPMARPFWFDRGFSVGEVGAAISTIGVAATIAGAWIAGGLVARFGIYRSMLVCGVLQIGSNVVYAVMAGIPAPGRSALYGTALVESLTYGLGTGAFIAFLMAICERERAATEYAMLSALFGLSRTLSGTASGAFADAFGYGPWFWLTVLLGIPGLLLVPFAKKRLASIEAEPVSPLDV